jgi:NADH dehydrogenase (ubiquinone) Fe-S protein 6
MRTILRFVRYSSSKAVVPQAPNSDKVWSASQTIKSAALVGPRFEQMNMQFQPNPPSAMECIAKVPIAKVASRVVSCDGGGGALGHPKVYINLDKPGPASCGIDL